MLLIIIKFFKSIAEALEDGVWDRDRDAELLIFEI